jgi:hypothetical protein
VPHVSHQGPAQRLQLQQLLWACLGQRLRLGTAHAHPPAHAHTRNRTRSVTRADL